MLSIKGLKEVGFATFHTLDDCRGLKQQLTGKQDIAIYGGGLVATELAIALLEAGYRVRLIVRSRILRHYFDPASEDYGPGIFYHILTDLIYKCLMADHVPEFQRVSAPHGLSILVMDYSTGRTGIARGESDLLDQVQQCCVDIASDDAAKNKVRKVLNIVGELDNKQELIKKRYEWYWREADSKKPVQSVLI